jgi:hypothetical protein
MSINTWTVAYILKDSTLLVSKSVNGYYHMTIPPPSSLKFPKIHCNTVILPNSPASKWLILKMFPCQNSKLISCLKNLNYRLVECHPNVTILTILDDVNIPGSYLSLVTWPLTSSLLGATIFSKHSVYIYKVVQIWPGLICM